MKLEFSRQFFEKYSKIKLYDNPSSGSRVVPYGQTDGRTEMTKLIVAFRNSANVPKTFFLVHCVYDFGIIFAINVYCLLKQSEWVLRCNGDYHRPSA
jgi:hypothetical protein